MLIVARRAGYKGLPRAIYAVKHPPTAWGQRGQTVTVHKLLVGGAGLHRKMTVGEDQPVSACWNHRCHTEWMRILQSAIPRPIGALQRGDPTRTVRWIGDQADSLLVDLRIHHVQGGDVA